jgi:hypothetical protein
VHLTAWQREGGMTPSRRSGLDDERVPTGMDARAHVSEHVCCWVGETHSVRQRAISFKEPKFVVDVTQRLWMFQRTDARQVTRWTPRFAFDGPKQADATLMRSKRKKDGLHVRQVVVVSGATHLEVNADNCRTMNGGEVFSEATGAKRSWSNVYHKPPLLRHAELIEVWRDGCMSMRMVGVRSAAVDALRNRHWGWLRIRLSIAGIAMVSRWRRGRRLLRRLVCLTRLGVRVSNFMSGNTRSSEELLDLIVRRLTRPRVAR